MLVTRFLSKKIAFFVNSSKYAFIENLLLSLQCGFHKSGHIYECAFSMTWKLANTLVVNSVVSICQAVNMEISDWWESAVPYRVV